MRNYKVNVNWSRWAPGTILREDELPEGTDIERSIQRGTITPIEGGFVAPIKDTDAKGWKARAEAIEEENQRLRTATPSASMLAEHEALKADHEKLKNDHELAQQELSEFRKGSVPRSTYDKTNGDLMAANAGFDRVTKELAELKKGDSSDAE